MNKVLTSLIVIGSFAAVAGGVFVGVGIATGESNSASVTNEKELSDDFENFNINMMISSVYVKKSEDGKNKVVSVENKKIYNDIKVENNTVFITQIDNRPWYNKIFNWNIFKFKTTVYLNESTYSKFDFKNNTGSLTVDSGFTFSTINAETDTGNINIDSSSTTLINAKSDTGAIKIKSVSVKDIKADCDTGSVSIENVNASGDIDISGDTGSKNLIDTKCDKLSISSSTGTVNITNTVVTDKMKINTSTGSVHFTYSDADSIEVKTSTGNIKGSLLTSKTFIAMSSTGNVEVPSSGSGGICILRTSTGNINISVPGL